MLLLIENKKVLWIVLLLRFSILFGEELRTRIRTFPNNFMLGTATAAYQIEGGWDADGKGPSIWDHLTHKYPEQILDRTNGDVATDSYNLYKEDVALLKRIGAQFYRFSFSWPRILPTGEISSLNAPGIKYYHRLIDELIQNEIEPVPTIYHWDLPQYLQDLGGWTSPLIVDYFKSFANLLFKEYGTKVKKWITFNEPKKFCGGYSGALEAPLLNASGVGDYLCAHHVILSHARVYHLYKDKYFPTQNGHIGLALNIEYAFPNDTNNIEDVKAADRYLQFELGLFAHPIFSENGDYPPIVREIVDRNSLGEGREWSRLPKLTPEMIEYVKGTSDFFGINSYTSRIFLPNTSNTYPNPSKQRDMGVIPLTKMEWPKGKSDWLYSVPKGLYNMLLWIRNSYGDVAIFITENGWSDNGELKDDNRIKYLNDHFNAVLDAIDSGANVFGHATWSLIDNFEWISGYSEKFGVFQVDVRDSNLTRVPKKSSYYLAEVFKTKQIVEKY